MIEQCEAIRDLIYLLQCQYCLLCFDKQCRLDDNYGRGGTKLVEDCSQLMIAGEDT
jgi:hypothetical protein